MRLGSRPSDRRARAAMASRSLEEPAPANTKATQHVRSFRIGGFQQRPANCKRSAALIWQDTFGTAKGKNVTAIHEFTTSCQTSHSGVCQEEGRRHKWLRLMRERQGDIFRYVKVFVSCFPLPLVRFAFCECARFTPLMAGETSCESRTSVPKVLAIFTHACFA